VKERLGHFKSKLTRFVPIGLVVKPTMEIETGDTMVQQKTVELCQAILDQPDFQSIRKRIDDFQANDQAQSLYRILNEKREHLEGKQQNGQSLTSEEIADFEKQRDEFLANSVAMAFMDAQQEIHQVRSSISKYVSRTFELGRLPKAEDMKCESCGNKHGCHS
jgi:cell fate (sporulation/competence/biofilm development) regulator YlbF (YheA/YmcA/DUF963 family)